jgi:hypothetical protein
MTKSVSTSWWTQPSVLALSAIETQRSILRSRYSLQNPNVSASDEMSSNKFTIAQRSSRCPDNHASDIASLIVFQ